MRLRLPKGLVAVNPFEWYGPEFLIFYAALSLLVIGALVWFRKKAEAGAAPRLELADPYLIAHLRGGANEVLRVAIVSLVDRDLLQADGAQLRTRPEVSPDAVRHPVEKALIRHFSAGGEAASVFDNHGLEQSCESYRARLEGAGLLPDEATRNARRLRLLAALAVLAGVALIKIFIGLARERPVLLLVISLAVAASVTSAVWSPRLTARGKAALEDIQSLYGGLKDRAFSLRAGGATAEVAMLAAVFGIGALEAEAFAYTKTLFPKAVKPSTGSSCGGSCGSSCGSSCGGGGCGGGCGGCGS